MDHPGIPQCRCSSCVGELSRRVRPRFMDSVVVYACADLLVLFDEAHTFITRQVVVTLAGSYLDPAPDFLNTMLDWTLERVRKGKRGRWCQTSPRCSVRYDST